MTATLLTFPVFRAFDSNGAPLAGGLLYSYQAGTTTPLATYVDQAGVTQNTNPVVLDSTGTANVWLGLSSYKFVLKDKDGVQQWSVDNISDPGAQAVAQLPNYTLKTDLASTTDLAKGDALVGVKQPLVNAVGRTQHSKNADIISVKDFGAVGDGITDDYQAIQNAIDALPSTGGSILFTDGIYAVSQSLVIAGKTDVVLYAESTKRQADVDPRVSIKATASMTDLLFIDGSSAYTHGWWLEGIDFNGNSNCTNAVVHVKDAPLGGATNCSFRAGVYGYHCEISDACTFHACFFQGSTAGFYISSHGDKQGFTACHFNESEYGVYIQPDNTTNAISFTDACAFELNTIAGIACRGVYGMVVTGNYFENPSPAYDIKFGVNNDVYLTNGVEISGNIFGSNDHVPIYLAHVDSFRIQNNAFGSNKTTLITNSGNEVSNGVYGPNSMQNSPTEIDSYTGIVWATDKNGDVKANGKIESSTGKSIKTDGTWNTGTFLFGGYYLWVDASGKLRIKSGAPTSDTDGTVVGTQA